MFLARPERHRIKITTKSVAEPLYQVGEDGPVSLDRTAAERVAFPISRQKYYVEVTEHREPPKGNFSNVARCRANGFLLGPTNYHSYQPGLRRLYEERFSRRMSFSDFQREIEVVSDPALVEKWKEQCSSVTVYRLRPPEASKASGAAESAKKEEPAERMEPAAEENPAAEAVQEENATEAAPVEAIAEEQPGEPAAAAVAYEGPVFATLAEVEQHFRENYLPGLIRTASSFHMSGQASREISDRGIATAVRQAWEQERGFPGQMMHQLRQHFSRSGLHVFKHRKRMQFVSLVRPSPMEDGSLSPSVAEILRVIQNNQNCNRASLAAAILGPDEHAADPARKTVLATDLHWLVETGRVIEFSDGRLDLPLVPAPVKPETPAAKDKAESAAEAGVADAPAPAVVEGQTEVPAEVAVSNTPEPQLASEEPKAEIAVVPEPAPEPVAETPVAPEPAPEPVAEIHAVEGAPVEVVEDVLAEGGAESASEKQPASPADPVTAPEAPSETTPGC
jgi:hypothetical protein